MAPLSSNDLISNSQFQYHLFLYVCLQDLKFVIICTMLVRNMMENLVYNVLIFIYFKKQESKGGVYY